MGQTTWNVEAQSGGVEKYRLIILELFIDESVCVYFIM